MAIKKHIAKQKTELLLIYVYLYLNLNEINHEISYFQNQLRKYQPTLKNFDPNFYQNLK